MRERRLGRAARGREFRVDGLRSRCALLQICRLECAVISKAVCVSSK
jgi:hypothetical protein